MSDLTTTEDALWALFDTLAADRDGTPVDELTDYVLRVFEVEPRPGVAPKPSAITFFWESETATDWLFRVRIYQDPSTDPAAAQMNLIRAHSVVGELLDADSRFGRSDWQAGYDGTLDALIAQAVIEVGREDI